MRKPSPRLRRTFRRLRTEGDGAVRETAAVALGVFIGCLPLYGLHLAICWTVGFVLGLNRLKMSLASNISNPLVAPWLIFAEIQVGALARRGVFHSLSRVEITTTTLGVFGVDALVGSLFVGGVLAAVAAAGTFRLVRRTGADPFFDDLLRRASDRYLAGSIIGWEVARARLRTDTLYRAVLTPRLLSCGGTVIDVGCGRGLMLALLAEARLAGADHRWPPQALEPPRFANGCWVSRPGRASRRVRELRWKAMPRSSKPACSQACRDRSGCVAVRRPPPPSTGGAGGASRRCCLAARARRGRPRPRTRC